MECSCLFQVNGSLFHCFENVTQMTDSGDTMKQYNLQKTTNMAFIDAYSSNKETSI